MFYGYARVSTAKQENDGHGLEIQHKKLERAGVEFFVEEVASGDLRNCKKLKSLLSLLSEGDTLVITSLDRLSRSMRDGAMIVQSLQKNGVIVKILNLGIADNTPMGKLMVTMLLAFAEFERDMIVERTQSGKAIARANGKRVDGRPKKFTPQQIEHAMNLLREGNSYTAVEEMTGISKSTLVREHHKKERK